MATVTCGGGDLVEHRQSRASSETLSVKLATNSTANLERVSRDADAGALSESWLWILIASLWTVLLTRLSSAWSADRELMHGWAVPVLCVLVARERRQTAPVPRAASAVVRVCGSLAVVAGGVGLLFLLPVLEANRLWPTAQWLAALAASGATLGWLAWAGGAAWVRHFAFPVFFMSTALAWPAFVQAPLVEMLSRWNAQLAAELASWAGHPAIARGNIIEVGSGWVGVDEACAGLRSLQAVWMMAWFFGELANLTLGRRVLLVLASLTVAFAGNAARTVFLTVAIAQDGPPALARWHDPAGYVALVATFVGVVVFAWWLARGRGRETLTQTPATTAVRLPRWPVAVALGAVLLAETGTRAWFAWRASEARGGQWQLAAATEDWRELRPAASVREILNYSSVDALQWTNPERTRSALAYVFRWENAGVFGSSGRGHEPEVCMPAIGARLEERPAALRLSLGGRELEFARYRFVTAGRTQHVFYAVWDAFAGRSVGETEEDFQWRARLRRVLEGRVRADRTHVVFVLETPNTVRADEAAAWMREAAARWLRAR